MFATGCLVLIRHVICCTHIHTCAYTYTHLQHDDAVRGRLGLVHRHERVYVRQQWGQYLLMTLLLAGIPFTDIFVGGGKTSCKLSVPACRTRTRLMEGGQGGSLASKLYNMQIWPRDLRTLQVVGTFNFIVTQTNRNQLHPPNDRQVGS